MKLLQKDVALAPFTTLKIGGQARYLVKIRNEKELLEGFNFAKENSLEIFILGGGSNVLISDKGFNGLVLHIAFEGIKISKNDEKVILEVGAGVDWDKFVQFCVEKTFAGIECLSGIPGFVGGTPVQNVGAYGQEVSETILEVKTFDRKLGKIIVLTNEQCGFAYRTSIFNTTEKDRYIVLGVTFCLKPNGEPAIRYADLKRYFEAKSSPSLAETRNAVIEIRKLKSMVIDENDPNSQSAGSFFKNPIVSNEDFLKIEAKAQASSIIKADEKVPSFPASESYAKIPAAWLIEKSGFQKGYAKGNAGISANHTLAIINRGSATAEEVVALMNEIQSRVEDVFEVKLKPEPVFVGFD